MLQFPLLFTLTGASLSPIAPQGFLLLNSPPPRPLGVVCLNHPDFPLDPHASARPQDGARSLTPLPDVITLPSLS